MRASYSVELFVQGKSILLAYWSCWPEGGIRIVAAPATELPHVSSMKATQVGGGVALSVGSCCRGPFHVEVRQGL